MEGKIMSVRCHLTISSRGAVRVTKNKPALDFDEISVALQLDLPQAIFAKPQLSAVLVVPDSAIMPSEIPVDVTNNVREAIEQSTGLMVHLTVGEGAKGE